MIELKGDLVVLKALERAHCHLLWEATEVEGPMPLEFFHPGLAVEHADKWFAEMQAKQGQAGVDLGIFTREGQVIGHIQLHHIGWYTRSADLGGGLARCADRGQGYGTDATRVILRYGFAHLGLHRIRANPLAMNTPAIRLLEKCGFSWEGRERDAFFFGGRWYDRVVYALLEQEFPFDGRLEPETGADLATQSVQARIARLIKAEDPHAPLSDQKIVEILQAQGVDIVRRTVAKYRDRLGILPARDRKRV